jgi:hypothetical protein
MNKIIYLSLFVLLFSSCEKIEDINQQVILKQEGDRFIENKSDAAKEIYDWLFTLIHK